MNAAGINHRTASLEFAEEDWDRVLQVNLKSAMYLSQAAARRFAEQGKGKIISVASAMSFQGGYIIPAYTAAKHGILGMTKALGNEFASLGITSTLSPGYMDTDMTLLIADPNRALPSASASRWPLGHPHAGRGRVSSVSCLIIATERGGGGWRLAEPLASVNANDSAQGTTNAVSASTTIAMLMPASHLRAGSL